MPRSVLFALATALMAVTSPLAAQTLHLAQTFKAPEDAGYFGYHIGFEGSEALILMQGYDAPERRRRYSLQRASLAQGQLSGPITPPHPDWNTSMIKGVQMDAGRILVCDDVQDAHDRPQYSFLLESRTGRDIARFESPEADVYRGRFAGSCAMHGDLVALSYTWKDKATRKKQGQMLLYDAQTGVLHNTLDLPETYGPIVFRRSVDIDARYIAVGTTGSDMSTGYFGRVDLYDRETLAHLHSFHRPPNGIRHNNGAFGVKVVLNGADLIVAATYDSETGREGGTVWIFDIESGAIKQRFISPLERKNHSFGDAISVQHGRLLVGQPDARVNGKKDAGAVWVFDYDTGDLLQGLLAPGVTSGASYGQRVVARPEGVLISAARAFEQPDAGGAVFFYRWDMD